MAANFFSRLTPVSIVLMLEFFLAALGLIFTDASEKSLIWGAVVVFLGFALDVWTTGHGGLGGDGQVALLGPFQFIRYPGLLSRFLMIFGLLIASKTPMLFAVSVLILTPFYRRLAESEDDWLKRNLGPRAVEYRAVVSGIIPQLIPTKVEGLVQPAFSHSFSWSTVLKDRSRRLLLVLLATFFLCQVVWIKRFMSDSLMRTATTVLVFSVIFILIKWAPFRHLGAVSSRKYA